MTISVTVKNVGEFTGKETVLVFVRLLGGRVIQRHKQLKAFDKIELMPDESTELTFTLSDDQFYFTDMDQLYKRADGCQIMVKNLSEEVSFKN